MQNHVGKGDTVSDQVYAVLKKEILSGALEGSSPLRQDDIAGQHNVSKIPVREALKRLRQKASSNSAPGEAQSFVR